MKKVSVSICVAFYAILLYAKKNKLEVAAYYIILRAQE